MLRDRVARIVLAILECFEDFIELELDSPWKIWAAQARDIRKATRDTNYICAANLQILMEWRMQADERWSSINGTSTRNSYFESQLLRWFDLREIMDHAISSMQLEVLLQKLRPG